MAAIRPHDPMGRPAGISQAQHTGKSPAGSPTVQTNLLADAHPPGVREFPPPIGCVAQVQPPESGVADRSARHKTAWT